MKLESKHDTLPCLHGEGAAALRRAFDVVWEVKSSNSTEILAVGGGLWGGGG